jgi:hypothetical protein
MTQAKGFTRDPKSNAVISVDQESLNTYRKEKEKILSQRALEVEVTTLKSDIKDIKDMLMMLANRIDK